MFRGLKISFVLSACLLIQMLSVRIDLVECSSFLATTLELVRLAPGLAIRRSLDFEGVIPLAMLEPDADLIEGSRLAQLALNPPAHSLRYASRLRMAVEGTLLGIPGLCLVGSDGFEGRRAGSPGRKQEANNQRE